jgi:hypothetical protein
LGLWRRPWVERRCNRRLPPTISVTILPACSLSPRQRPPPSVPRSIVAASYQPRSSCAGCSLVSPTMCKRGSARGPLPAGSLYLAQSGGRTKKGAEPKPGPHRAPFLRQGGRMKGFSSPCSACDRCSLSGTTTSRSPGSSPCSMGCYVRRSCIGP